MMSIQHLHMLAGLTFNWSLKAFRKCNFKVIYWIRNIFEVLFFPLDWNFDSISTLISMMFHNILVTKTTNFVIISYFPPLKFFKAFSSDSFFQKKKPFPSSAQLSVKLNFPTRISPSQKFDSCSKNVTSKKHNQFYIYST